LSLREESQNLRLREETTVRVRSLKICINSLAVCMKSLAVCVRSQQWEPAKVVAVGLGGDSKFALLKLET
jgi:hypothetical protein